MTSITRTSSGASANSLPASSPAPAGQAKTPVAKTSHLAQHTVLSDRPPSQSDAGAVRPRRPLNNLLLSSSKKSADTPPDVAASAAATLCKHVDNGTIKLVGSYSAAAITAASMAASQGLLALQRDVSRPTDPPGPTSA
jgi:hypothetical protein